MTHQENNEPVSMPAAFAGAQRAAGYVEAEHTMHGQELHAVRAAAALIDVDEEPAEIDQAEPRPSRSRRFVPGEIPDPGPRRCRRRSRSRRLLRRPRCSQSRSASFPPRPRRTSRAVATKGMRGAISRIGIRMAPGAAEAAELKAGRSAGATNRRSDRRRGHAPSPCSSRTPRAAPARPRVRFSWAASSPRCAAAPSRSWRFPTTPAHSPSEPKATRRAASGSLCATSPASAPPASSPATPHRRRRSRQSSARSADAHRLTRENVTRRRGRRG